MPDGLRGILFDKDGVLIDYEATWDPANRRLAQRLAAGDETLARRLLIAGGYDREVARPLPGTPLAGGTPPEIAALWQALLPAWEEAALTEEIDRSFDLDSPGLARPVTELSPLLTALRARGLILGLATNDSAYAAQVSLERLGAVEHLDFLAGYDSGHGAKPGPGMAKAFCGATGLDPAEVMMVGDSRHDMEMARAAGLGILVGVLSGTGARADLEALADHLIEDVTALEALLERL